MTVSAITALALLSLGVEPTIIVETHQISGKPVVVVRPQSTKPLPVVYAFAGLGEMIRGPRASAHGWVEKYGLKEAMMATMRKTLAVSDLHGLVAKSQLAEYQRRVSQFRGIIVVCPAATRKYRHSFARYLFHDVVPWIEEHIPVKKGPRYRGIDGISLGGRHALLVALQYPSEFRTVGTEQASVKGLWSRFITKYKRPSKSIGHLTFHLLTSDADPFQPDIQRFADHLRSLDTRVVYQQTPGRHDKRFAKGPGAIEMLLFHDKYLWAPTP